MSDQIFTVTFHIATLSLYDVQNDSDKGHFQLKRHVLSGYLLKFFSKLRLLKNCTETDNFRTNLVFSMQASSYSCSS